QGGTDSVAAPVHGHRHMEKPQIHRGRRRPFGGSLLAPACLKLSSAKVVLRDQPGYRKPNNGIPNRRHQVDAVTALQAPFKSLMVPWRRAGLFFNVHQTRQVMHFHCADSQLAMGSSPDYVHGLPPVCSEVRQTMCQVFTAGRETLRRGPKIRWGWRFLEPELPENRTGARAPLLKVYNVKLTG